MLIVLLVAIVFFGEKVGAIGDLLGRLREGLLGSKADEARNEPPKSNQP